ncbi:hypothetical protein [Pseudothermotoga sp.]
MRKLLVLMVALVTVAAFGAVSITGSFSKCHAKIHLRRFKR